MAKLYGRRSEEDPAADSSFGMISGLQVRIGTLSSGSALRNFERVLISCDFAGKQQVRRLATLVQ